MNKTEINDALKTLEELPCEPRCQCLITCNPDHCNCAKKTLRDLFETLDIRL